MHVVFSGRDRTIENNQTPITDNEASMDDYTEDFNHEKPPACPEESRRFDQLPTEVLAEIFQHLSSNDRKNVRLVCTTLYEACGWNEHVHIRNENQWEEFRNCRLNNMHVTIDFIVGEWDPVVWQEVGPRIRSLHMNTCTAGCGSLTIEKIGLKNVIMFCENLRKLRISLRNGNAERFSSPTALQEINIVRNKLETLIIQRKNFSSKPGCRADKWTKVFTALLQIFPNIQHYTIGWICQDNGTLGFNCSCSVKPEFTDRSALARGLAFMLSGSEAYWNSALDVFSTMRLSAVTFVDMYDGRVPHSMAIPAFFKKPKALIADKKNHGSDVGFTASEESAFEKSVSQRIASHWGSFRELLYDKTGLLRIWAFCHSRIDISDLDSQLSNSNDILLDVETTCDNIGMVYNSGPPTLKLRHEVPITDIYSRNFLKRHEFIEELMLTLDVSDKMLQTIFQFMTRLRVLIMCLGRHNTCFGLVGSAGRTTDCSSGNGYSIKRLQQLGELWITSDGFSFEDRIFDEFDFPKLYHFNSFPPKELKTLRNLILGLPALKDVTFFNTEEVSTFLDVICPVRGTPITLHFPAVLESFSDLELKNFFNSHPSLHALITGVEYTMREDLDHS